MSLCNDYCTCLDFEGKICSPCDADPEVVTAHTAEATAVALAHNADGILDGTEDTNATGDINWSDWTGSLDEWNRHQVIENSIETNGSRLVPVSWV